MADLKFTVDYSQVKAANKEIVQIGGSAKKSASVFEAAFKKAEAQQKKSLNSLRQQIAFSKKMEVQKAKEAKVTSNAAAMVAKEEERLKNKFVEGYTAMNIYSKEMNDLALARKKGLISTKEQTAAVASLNAQMKAGTGAFANAATGMQIVGKRANRTGMLAQQAGYQFGDFAVQVQSGTNPMVAFGQQATQLIGTFSMLAKSTRAIMAFSALGVIVPILTAIGAGLMRMKSANDETAQSAKNLDDKLKALKETLRDYAELQAAIKEGVSLEFKTASGGVDQAKQDLADAEAALERAKLISIGAAGGITLGRSDKLDGAMTRATENSVSYKAALSAVTEARKTLADLEAKEADARAVDYKETLTGQEAFVNSLLQTRNIQSSYYGKTTEEQEKLNGQVALHSQLLELGLTPSDHLYLKAVQYYEQMVSSREATSAMAAALEEAAEAQAGLTDLSESYETQLALVNAEITALEQGKNAEVAAFLEGERIKATALYNTSTAVAQQTGNIIAMAEASLAYLDAMSALDALSEARGKLATLKKPKKARGGGGGGGASKKSPAEEFAKYLDGLTKQAELEKELVGLFGAKRAEEEAVIKARQKYGKETVAAQETELRGTLAQIEADKERQRVLEEARQQQEGLADSMASSFGDAFTSVVDGTKSMGDAFRDMAKDIIKQLFEILVVKRLVGSAEQGKESGLAGFLVKGLGAMMGGGTGGSSLAPAVPSANGNVLSNGIIQAYANGGVVGGPTYFPMAGGKTGLMGEAGPEAIMPLKRGANGKLGVQTDGGSQGNVVVNQSFNFSANGDDSVKKLIAQAAPQIANMTKQSMMNDRRRGGQMKATFG